MNSSPIFIGGFFKSGTSLLRTMLGQHSNISAGLETYWFSIDTSDKAALEKKAAQLAKFYEMPQNTVEEIAKTSASRADFLDLFMSKFTEQQAKKRWLEKTPGNILHLDEIFIHWPTAQFIHISRDPRDIYVSMFEAGKISSLEDFARDWSRFAIAAENHSSIQKADDRHFLDVCYETLVMDSETEIRRILAFLGETWEQHVAEHVGSKVDYNKVLDITGKQSITLRRLAEPMTKNRIGIWQNAMTPKDLAQFEEYLTKFDSIKIFQKRVYEICD